MGKHNGIYYPSNLSNKNLAKIYETQSAPPSPSGGRSRLRIQPDSTSFDDLDLPQTSSNLELVFCCRNCTDSVTETSFVDFTKATCPPFDGSLKTIGSICQHVIVLDSGLKNPSPNTPKKPARYFVFIETVGQYQEIDSILFTYLLDTSDFEETTSKARFTCHAHRQTYQLTRQNRRIETDEAAEPTRPYRSITPAPTQPSTEGKGECEVISPKQASFEKRKFLVKKLGYGRKDQVDEIIRSIQSQGKDEKPRINSDWDWEKRLEAEQLEMEQHQQEKKEEEKFEQERFDFEVEHCLGLLRMFFLMGKKFVIA